MLPLGGIGSAGGGQGGGGGQAAGPGALNQGRQRGLERKR